MIETSIRITDGQTRWGLVKVLNEEGTTARDVVISAADADAVRASVRGVPPGVTPAEWESGRAVLLTYAMTPGTATITKDGGLVVMFGIDRSAGKVAVKTMLLPASQWALDASGGVMLPPLLASVLDAGFAAVEPDALG